MMRGWCGATSQSPNRKEVPGLNPSWRLSVFASSPCGVECFLGVLSKNIHVRLTDDPEMSMNKPNLE